MKVSSLSWVIGIVKTISQPLEDRGSSAQSRNEQDANEDLFQSFSMVSRIK